MAMAAKRPTFFSLVIKGAHLDHFGTQMGATPLFGIIILTPQRSSRGTLNNIIRLFL